MRIGQQAIDKGFNINGLNKITYIYTTQMLSNFEHYIKWLIKRGKK